MSSPAFWDERYARRDDGWELGEPAPALVSFVEATPPPRGRVAVLGCGRGHDVRYLARRGYDAVGVDFSSEAVRAARALARRARVDVRFEQRDLFDLEPGWAGAFDGVWEYTCFCAIDPRRRARYVDVVASLLRPGGWLLACFYPIRRYGAGPPFPVARHEVRRLFTPPFRFERELTPVRSVRRRQGQEWMVLARKTRAAS